MFRLRTTMSTEKACLLALMRIPLSVAHETTEALHVICQRLCKHVFKLHYLLLKPTVAYIDVMLLVIVMTTCAWRRNFKSFLQHQWPEHSFSWRMWNVSASLTPFDTWNRCYIFLYSWITPMQNIVCDMLVFWDQIKTFNVPFLCVCVCVCTSKTFLCSLNDATCVFLNYQQECTVKLPLQIRCVQSISLHKGALIRQCVVFVYSDVILYSYEDMRLPLHNAFFFCTMGYTNKKTASTSVQSVSKSACVALFSF